jgi:hypothetical protein
MLCAIKEGPIPEHLQALAQPRLGAVISAIFDFAKPR